jgi:hypothetical protein
MIPAFLAALIASSQYSCCSLLVVARSKRLHLSRHLLSSIKFSVPIDSWFAISLRSLVLWRLMIVPDVWSCTNRHRYIHWAWVTCRSCVTSPIANLSGERCGAYSRRCDSWMEKSFADTIPIIKFPQPILSCDSANSWMMDGYPTAQAVQEARPLPMA